MRYEQAEVNGQIGDGAQGTEERELALRLLRISWGRMDNGGEVPHAVNLVVGEDSLTQYHWIEPLVGSTFDAAVIEVEAVNVDVRPHKTLHKRQGPPHRRPRTLHPKVQGMVLVLYHILSSVSLCSSRRFPRPSGFPHAMLLPLRLRAMMSQYAPRAPARIACERLLSSA